MNKRVAAPAPAPIVPWSQQQTPVSQEVLDAEAAFEEQGNGLSAIPAFKGVDPIPPSPEEKRATQAQIDSAFSGQPTAQKSPFAPKPKPKAEPEPEPFPMGDAPLWGDLVRFVQKHGDKIIQARHPQPRGICVDTIYRGVTVFPYPETQLRHVDYGWIDWKDAQYD